MMTKFHNPVLLNEAIQGLKISPNGVYVDATFGGGGHSKSILEMLNKEGRLLSFDQDEDTYENKINDSRFKFISANFNHLSQYLKYYGVESVDGVLADFGVSSHHFDTASRGFSIRKKGRLDMRMNQNQKLDAHYVINNYEEIDLNNLFFNYGEVRNSKKISKQILSSREKRVINTTSDLVELLKPLTPFRYQKKFLAQIFQAIRIEVNNEIEVLKSFLEQATKSLKTGGRIVCISYHSLEDRCVKRYIQFGNFEGKDEKDLYGNSLRVLRKIGKVVVPSEKEIIINKRARSAKMRIAEKI
ncbi:MAG: 16S rRNA (cytosine(1402)-N(4))-methyltransferase [Flavobacteriaceae bacterium]|nr:16S rRNA (cytosine(1402)-N(4))-methyltransferase [Flavobacteriaceae bacterium]